MLNQSHSKGTPDLSSMCSLVLELPVAGFWWKWAIAIAYQASVQSCHGNTQGKNHQLFGKKLQYLFTCKGIISHQGLICDSLCESHFSL
jgi:hypothetical protein